MSRELEQIFKDNGILPPGSNPGIYGSHIQIIEPVYRKLLEELDQYVQEQIRVELESVRDSWRIRGHIEDRIESLTKPTSGENMSKGDVAKEDLRTRFWVNVVADDVVQHPDIMLRMVIKQSIIQYTEYDMTLDEALVVLRSEVENLEAKIRNAT